MKAHASIVVNPRAGGGRRVREVSTLALELMMRSWDVDIVVPEDAEGVREAVRRSLHSSADCIVIAGGDGTWHHAVQAGAGFDVPFALLPIGTGDDNARSLDIPARAPRLLAERIDSRRSRAIDLGRMECAGGIRWLSGIASIGFDSRVNDRANGLGGLPGTLRYLVAAAVELTRLTPSTFSITTDQGTITREAILVAVGNGGFYGGGMAICPDFRMDDGLLDVTIIGPLPRWRFSASLPTVYRGSHVRQREVSTAQTSFITIEADAELVFADGEPVGATPVTIRSVPEALRIVSA